MLYSRSHLSITKDFHVTKNFRVMVDGKWNIPLIISSLVKFTGPSISYLGSIFFVFWVYTLENYMGGKEKSTMPLQIDGFGITCLVNNLKCLHFP